MSIQSVCLRNTCYMLCLCSYVCASNMWCLGMAVSLRECCAHLHNVCACVKTIFGWLCVPRGTVCLLAEYQSVSHHVCGVWVWLWVSELGSCESLGVGCVVWPCVFGSVYDHAGCAGVTWCLGVARRRCVFTVQTVVCDHCVSVSLSTRMHDSSLLCPRHTPAPP